MLRDLIDTATDSTFKDISCYFWKIQESFSIGIVEVSNKTRNCPFVCKRALRRIALPWIKFYFREISFFEQTTQNLWWTKSQLKINILLVSNQIITVFLLLFCVLYTIGK